MNTMVEITKDKFEEHINVFMTRLTDGSSAMFLGFDSPNKVFFFRCDGDYKVVLAFDRIYREDNLRFVMVIEKTFFDKKEKCKYYRVDSIYSYKQQTREKSDWEAFAMSDYDYGKIDKLPVSWIWEKYDKKTLEKDLKIEVYPDPLNNLNTPVLSDKGLNPIIGCRFCSHSQRHEWQDGLFCTKIDKGWDGKQIPRQSVDYENERPKWCPLARTVEDGKKEYLELGKKLGYVKDGN